MVFPVVYPALIGIFLLLVFPDHERTGKCRLYTYHANESYFRYLSQWLLYLSVSGINASPAGSLAGRLEVIRRPTESGNRGAHTFEQNFCCANPFIFRQAGAFILDADISLVSCIF